MSFKNYLEDPACYLYKATKPIQKNIYCKKNHDFAINKYCSVS